MAKRGVMAKRFAAGFLLVSAVTGTLGLVVVIASSSLFVPIILFFTAILCAFLGDILADYKPEP
jgi:hypothetical protein